MRALGLKKKWPALLLLLSAAAFVLWPWLTTKESTLAVPVTYANIPAGFTTIAPTTKVIEVVVRGPKSKVKKAKKNKTITYTFDLSKAQYGMNSFPVQVRDIPFSKSISVLRANRSLVVVKIDRLMQRELPVRMVFSGKPGAGFVIRDSSIEPAMVLVSGPETRLGAVTEIKTKPIDISGIKSVLKQTATMDLPEDVELLFPKDSLTANVFIEERIIIKTFPGVRVSGKDASHGYTIVPEHMDLQVKGPQNSVEKLSSETGLEVFIDLSGVSSGVHERYAIIRLPVSILPVRVTPDVFTVTVYE